MAGVSTPIQRGRILRQQIPTPPPHYDQTYVSQLVSAVNDYMTQAASPGDVVAGRFILSDPTGLIVGDMNPSSPNYDPRASLPNTSTLPTGTLYLTQVPGAAQGTYYLAVVLP